jgi:hypothetical protein
VRQLAGQLVLSALIVLHVAAGAASEARDTAWGRAIYDQTRAPQATLALWQNWAMFSPPPRTTSSLVARGRLPDGSWVDLPLPHGPGEPGTLTLRYSRFGKLERSAFKASRAKLQRSIAHWVCRQARAAGEPVDQVQLLQRLTWTPAPSERRQATPRVEEDPKRRVVCR